MGKIKGYYRWLRCFMELVIWIGLVRWILNKRCDGIYLRREVFC